MARCELLRGREGLEIIVIRHDFEGVPGPFQLGAPFLQGFDNCEELLVVDVVVALLDGVF